MATRIAVPAAGHPIDWVAAGKKTAERPWIDGDIRGGHRAAAAILLGMTGVLFAAPPAVALLVMIGFLR